MSRLDFGKTIIVCARQQLTESLRERKVRVAKLARRIEQLRIAAAFRSTRDQIFERPIRERRARCARAIFHAALSERRATSALARSISRRRHSSTRLLKERCSVNASRAAASRTSGCSVMFTRSRLVLTRGRPPGCGLVPVEFMIGIEYTRIHIDKRQPSARENVRIKTRLTSPSCPSRKQRTA